MKICRICNNEMTIDNFYMRDRGKRPSTMCKKCFIKYTTLRWRRIKENAVLYKGGKCERCGYNKCIDAFDLHHNNPSEKEFDWRSMRRKSKEILYKELDKCSLLCSNCHRELHYETKTY